MKPDILRVNKDIFRVFASFFWVVLNKYNVPPCQSVVELVTKTELSVRNGQFTILCRVCNFTMSTSWFIMWSCVAWETPLWFHYQYQHISNCFRGFNWNCYWIWYVREIDSTWCSNPDWFYKGILKEWC